MPNKSEIERGSLVRLKARVAEGDTTKARVKRMLDDVEGGVLLDRRLNGFAYWNITDLIHLQDQS